MSINSYSTVLGVPFLSTKMSSFLTSMDVWIQKKDKHQFSLVNLHSLVTAKKDAVFFDVLTKGSLNLADGIPVVWASRFLRKTSIPERIAGPDLCWRVCQEAQQKKWRVFFLGSTPDVLKKIKIRLAKELPDLDVAYESPPMKKSFSLQDNEALYSKINAFQPDILWVGMTAPKQEKWIFDNLTQLNCSLAFGVGAAFDFLAKTKHRAPLWMRHLGLEWLHRLFQEPARLWKRYLYHGPLFCYYLLIDILKHKS